MMYDLDGDFWGPYRQARLNGSFTLESVKAAEASGDLALMFGPRQDTTFAATAAQPSTQAGDGQPHLSQSQSNNILPPPTPMEPVQPIDPPTADAGPSIIEPASQYIIPDSEQGDPDIVPSSWNTEDNAVASSGG
ncbi:hypothetical protein QFC22_003444 [Naganishia vaughanmartiniae]|uniref:Uncharacterized protein n=1 Tax=Naganishia vaughanmartiniae TaxID=1424756 RepID=A0ACC2X8J6_9TREE|nr:hypothetical protein QFC22_003444 [Naganishia vaughanmartiniae]